MIMGVIFVSIIDIATATATTDVDVDVDNGATIISTATLSVRSESNTTITLQPIDGGHTNPTTTNSLALVVLVDFV